MAEEKTFAALLAQAPKLSSSSITSLVGTLAQTDDKGKFVLFLSSGGSVTLDTSAVKSHTVLGYSAGQTIVRVDVDSAALPQPVEGSAQPFSLATQHQISTAIAAQLGVGPITAHASGTLGDVGTPASYDIAAHASGTLGDVGTPASYDIAAHASGTLGDVGTPASYDIAAHASGTLGDVGTPASYDIAAHASGTLGDVGTPASYDIAAHASGTLGDVGTPASYDIAAHASGTLGDVGTPASYDIAVSTPGETSCIPAYD